MKRGHEDNMTARMRARLLAAVLLASCAAAFAPSARAAAPQKAQDGLYSIYSSTSATSAAKYHAWRLLRRKNPALPRPHAFSFGQTGVPPAVGFIVAAKGGKVARFDKAEIILPPGALTANMLVTISSVVVRSQLEATVQARQLAAANLVAVSSAVAFGPEATALKTPATLILPYDRTKLQAQGLGGFNLQVFRWNRDKQTWDWMPTTANQDGMLSAQVPRLSVYQVLARRPRGR